VQNGSGPGSPGHREGTGAAAAAHLPVFTDAAFAVVVVEVAHLQEEFRGLPDLREGLLLDVARLLLEKAADLHLAHMGHEGEALAAHAALGHGIEAVRLGRDGLPLFLLALAEDAVVMGRAGGLELDRHLVPHS